MLPICCSVNNVAVSLHIASVVYTLSTPFLEELNSCASDFKERSPLLKNKLQCCGSGVKILPFPLPLVILLNHRRISISSSQYSSVILVHFLYVSSFHFHSSFSVPFANSDPDSI